MFLIIKTNEKNLDKIEELEKRAEELENKNK